MAKLCLSAQMRRSGATAENPLDLDDDVADGGASNHTSDHDSWYGQPTKHNTDRGGNRGSWMTVHKDEDHSPGSSSESEADENDSPKPSDDAYVCIPRPADDTLKPEASLDVGDFFQKSAAEHSEWPWIMQWGAWEQCREMERSPDVRQPDNFHMCM